MRQFGEHRYSIVLVDAPAKTAKDGLFYDCVYSFEGQRCMDRGKSRAGETPGHSIQSRFFDIRLNAAKKAIPKKRCNHSMLF
jgi:hypothetical protein